MKQSKTEECTEDDIATAKKYKYVDDKLHRD
jgi:hypothetical protein